MLLECININKSFEKIEVLKGVDLRLYSGEIVTILGESGCGKSTFLRLILGLEKLDSGYIKINSQIIADGKKHTPPNRRELSMMFQDYALMPHLNVKKNILFSIPKVNKNEQEKRLKDIVSILKIENLLSRYIHELSGGQQQRVALARALISQPKLILFDEPFSNLDENLKQSLREELKTLIKKINIGAIFVTHDKQDAFSISDKIALMENGQIGQIGNPKELYEHPNSLYVAKFMGDINFFITPREDGSSKYFGVRPEECFLAPNDNRCMQGKVIDIAYMGNCNRIKIKLNNQNKPIHIKIPCWQNIKLNQIVQVGYKEEKIISFEKIEY